MTGKRPELAEVLDREAVSAVLLLALVALAVTPRNVAALTGLLTVLAAPALLLALRPRVARPTDRPTAAVVATFGIAGGVLVLTSLAAADLRVSLFGMPIQHNGSAMWLGLAITAALLVSRWRAGDPGRVARASALFCGALGLAAVLDWFGLFTGWRPADRAAGLLENSTSLTQILVVGLGCAVAWAASKRGAHRAVAVSAALLCAAGLAAGWSRGAGIGVAVAVAVVVIYTLARKRLPNAHITGALVLVTAMLVVLATVWVTMGTSVNPELPAWVSRLSSGRAAIWTSAFAQFRESPVVGEGASQFTSWVLWSAEPGGTVSVSGTNDPHNILIAWLLGGGVLGLGAFLLAAFAALWAFFGVLDNHGSKTPAAATAAVCGLLAWGVTVMFGWVTPIGGLLAAMVTASLLPLHRERTKRAEAPRTHGFGMGTMAVGLAGFGVALCIWSWPVVAAEYGSGPLMDSGLADSGVFAAAGQATGDAFCVSIAVDGLVKLANEDPGNRQYHLSSADRLKPVLLRAAAWDVYSAFALADLLVEEGNRAEGFDWAGYELAISAGKLADPASGVWDYLGAVRAMRLERSGDAAAYARRALQYGQPPAVRQWLLGIAATPQ